MKYDVSHPKFVKVLQSSVLNSMDVTGRNVTVKTPILLNLFKRSHRQGICQPLSLRSMMGWGCHYLLVRQFSKKFIAQAEMQLPAMRKCIQWEPC